MSKSNNQDLMPALRFRQDDGTNYPNWDVVTLKSLARQITEEGSQNKVGECAYIYDPKILSTAPVGMFSKNRFKKRYLGSKYKVFQFNNSNDDFYEYFFQSSKWQAYVQNTSDSEFWIKYMNLKDADFMLMPLPKPTEEEQQKIAACFLSIDELITSQTRELKVLEDHRDGLLQQLFPAEDETLPELRFPEFQGKGHWSHEALGNLLQRQLEYGVRAHPGPRTSGLPTYLRIVDIPASGYLNTEDLMSVAKKDVSEDDYLEPGDLVLGYKLKVGSSYRCRKADGRLVFASLLIRVRPETSKLNPDFLAQFLKTEQYWRWVNKTETSGATPSISRDQYALLSIPHPSSIEEQTKIAAVLESIDELINTVTTKIETLQAHKAGLLQQLFPEMDKLS